VHLPRICGCAAAACLAALTSAAALAAARAEPERTIDVVSVVTGHVREVMADSAGEGPPLSLSWTPDAHGLVYMRSPCDGCAEIRLLRFAAGTGQLGAIVGEGRAPALARDGKTLVYVGSDGGIYTSALAGRRAHTVVPGSISSGGVDQPRLSPDGRSVAFMRAQSNGKWSIQIVSRAGGRERRLTPPGLASSSPVWSPDGRTIAFSAQGPDGRWQIALVPAGGGKPRVLRDDGGSDSFPTWSPDGRRIAFVREHGRAESIYVRDVSGGALRRVTPPALDAIQPAWSPSGDEIAFVVNSGETD
jgi:Tol biopolymer transport system component